MFSICKFCIHKNYKYKKCNNLTKLGKTQIIVKTNVIDDQQQSEDKPGLVKDMKQMCELTKLD